MPFGELLWIHWINSLPLIITLPDGGSRKVPSDNQSFPSLVSSAKKPAVRVPLIVFTHTNDHMKREAEKDGTEAEKDGREAKRSGSEEKKKRFGTPRNAKNGMCLTHACQKQVEPFMMHVILYPILVGDVWVRVVTRQKKYE